MDPAIIAILIGLACSIGAYSIALVQLSDILDTFNETEEAEHDHS